MHPISVWVLLSHHKLEVIKIGSILSEKMCIVDGHIVIVNSMKSLKHACWMICHCYCWFHGREPD